MALTPNSARRGFLEHHLRQTDSLARLADQRSWPSYGLAGTAAGHQVSAEAALLTELEKHSGPRKTNNEPQPLSTTNHSGVEEEEIGPIASARKPPSIRGRATGYVALFFIIFGVGVGSGFAWRHGDELREMIANSYPQLGWLAPQAALANGVSEPAPTVSHEESEIKAIALTLAAMQQSVDRLSAQLADNQQKSVDRLSAQLVDNQQQITGEIAKLEQDIIDKISSPAPRPVASPAHKPVPAAPRASAQDPAER